MKAKPNINDFLQKGAAAAAEKNSSEAIGVGQEFSGSQDKITKTIRIKKSLDNNLKQESTRLTIQEGRRVTESDLIERALLKYLNK